MPSRRYPSLHNRLTPERIWLAAFAGSVLLILFLGIYVYGSSPINTQLQTIVGSFRPDSAADYKTTITRPVAPQRP